MILNVYILNSDALNYIYKMCTTGLQEIHKHHLAILSDFNTVLYPIHIYLNKRIDRKFRWAIPMKLLSSVYAVD